MSTFNADEFFASQPEPPTLQDSLRDVEAFLKLQKERKRKVVLITVSCPFVPVDNIIATQYSNAEWWYNSSFRAQCVWRITLCVISTPELTEPLHSYATSVRFLDNFSAGTRGSSSAEHFLRTNDYAVIFMHRQHSLQPFSRHYSHSTHSFLDLMDLPQEDKTEYQGEGLFPPLSGVAAPSTSSTSNQGALLISEPNLTPLRTLLHSYKLVNSLNLLHQMHFTTVQEYLFLLRGVSRLMAQYLGPKALYYLAAAVSDFFIPQQKLVRCFHSIYERPEIVLMLTLTNRASTRFNPARAA